jgi:hypothetical protein
MDSIMMYSSLAGNSGGEGLDDAVLIKIQKDGQGKNVPASNWQIPEPTSVSPRDAAFVKAFYPWDETRARQHRALKLR